MAKWTRDQIIRELLRREASGLSLSHGGDHGVEHVMYRAGVRIFGSWLNAVKAAGITPHRAQVYERWSPNKVLSLIGSLSRRRRPLRPGELNELHSGLVRAARRFFGSWPKAVIAAGVDPLKLSYTMPWTKERIIESILTRALNNEALDPRVMRAKALTIAGEKVFGAWGAALAAAGLDPIRYIGAKSKACITESSYNTIKGDHQVFPSAKKRKRQGSAADLKKPSDSGSPISTAVHQAGDRWSDQSVRQAILARLHQHRMMHGQAVRKDDLALYQASRRRYGSWSNALLAAGLNPDEFCKYGSRTNGRRQSRSVE